MNPIEIEKLYKKICMLYSKPMLDITECRNLADVFADYSYREIDNAFTEYMKKEVYFPKPANLIQIANKKREAIRRAEAEEAKRRIRYDKNGSQIYKCDYCQDTGYMLVDDGGIYAPVAYSCVHNHPIKRVELKQNDRVKITTIGYNSEMITRYYEFDPVRLCFVPEGTAKAISGHVDIEQVSMDKVAEVFGFKKVRKDEKNE